MTAPMETQIAIELETNARKLHEQARAVEERWRTAHGFDTKLRGKHQVEAKRKWQRLERGEVRRREERELQRVERQMLARSLLKGVEGRCRAPTSNMAIEPSDSSEVFRSVRHAEVRRFKAEGWEPGAHTTVSTRR